MVTCVGNGCVVDGEPLSFAVHRVLAQALRNPVQLTLSPNRGMDALEVIFVVLVYIEKSRL